MGNSEGGAAMILRAWFRFLGVVLSGIIAWGSLWAGFENFNLFAALRSSRPLSHSLLAVINFCLVALAVWMLRGGPQLDRDRK